MYRHIKDAGGLNFAGISMKFASLGSGTHCPTGEGVSSASYETQDARVSLVGGKVLHVTVGSNSKLKLTLINGSPSLLGTHIGDVSIEEMRVAVEKKLLSVNGRTLSFSRIPRGLKRIISSR